MTASAYPAYLVTGAATGIGAAVVRRLAATGARVIGAGLDADEGERLQHELTAQGARFEFHAADVTDQQALAELLSDLDGLDVLDGLVTCAGIYPPACRLESVSLEEFRQVLEVNLVGTFLACRAALPALRRRGGGAIVTVSSVHANAAAPGQGAYAASKAAIVGLTRQLAVDYAADGIRANSVLAGSVDTRITRAALAAAGGADALCLSPDPHALGRIADADEVARVIEFLVTDQSSFVTGAALLADGGLTARIL